MNEFTEKHHAFIAASFYDVLTKKFGERGKQAFIMATRRYAEQRGNRMAQRAVRDGRKLDFAAYCEYGEWVSTQTAKDLGCSNESHVDTYAPDYVTHITRCPWAAQFAEMDMRDAGVVYCTYLDPSIVRGFNPELTFITEQSLHDHDFCIQRVVNAGLYEGFKAQKKMEYVKGFDYHCGHNYKTYSQYSEAIFGKEGKACAEEVLKRFEKKYGREMTDVLLSYLDTDFNMI